MSDLTVAQLLSELTEVQNEIKGLEEREAIIRDMLLVETTKAGGKMSEAGYALSVVTPKPRVSYETKSIDAFIIECTQNGDMHTANALSALRKLSEPKPYLTVKKEA